MLNHIFQNYKVLFRIDSRADSLTKIDSSLSLRLEFRNSSDCKIFRKQARTDQRARQSVKQWTGKNCLPFVTFWNVAAKKKEEEEEKKDKNETVNLLCQLLSKRK